MALEAPEKTVDAPVPAPKSPGINRSSAKFFSNAAVVKKLSVFNLAGIAARLIPSLKTGSGGSGISITKRPRKKNRRLPPGQRLVRAMAAAAALTACQSLFNPLTGPCEGVTSGAHIEVPLAAPFALATPLTNLREHVHTVCQVKKLTPGVFAIDPATGAYLDYQGSNSYSAASMIKVPVLVALFNAIDNGDIDPDVIMSIKPDHVAGGSGHLQWRPVGTKLPLLDVAELMIIISDNTATNMIIDLLGGKKAVNKKFVQWGLKNTVINAPLADLAGTNKTSPYDLVYLLARVERGELMSDVWRNRMRYIMGRTKTRTLINQGIPAGAKLAHKTGDIGSMVGDCGVITTPDGHKLIMAMQVQRPHNDRRANELIRTVTGIVYSGFEKTRPALESQLKALKPNPAKLDLTRPLLGSPEVGPAKTNAAIILDRSGRNP